jgi:hypothetical protein
MGSGADMVHPEQQVVDDSLHEVEHAPSGQDPSPSCRLERDPPDLFSSTMPPTVTTRQNRGNRPSPTMFSRMLCASCGGYQLDSR